MLDLEMDWEVPADNPADLFVVQANGASPADQSVTVIAWLVQAGETVRAGQRIAEVESDKSVLDISSPLDGVLESILVPEGDSVSVGASLALIDAQTQGEVRRRPIREEPGVPRFKRRPIPGKSRTVEVDDEAKIREIGMSRAYCATGALDFRNEDVTKLFPRRTPGEVLKRFGIERRHRLAEDESVLTIGVQAATDAHLQREELSIAEIDLIVCSTNTPIFTVPSLACMILNVLDGGQGRRETAAYDLIAACTGYLYGLAAGL